MNANAAFDLMMVRVVRNEDDKDDDEDEAELKIMMAV